jgi:tetratricopeptide (TPR) repeat protein
VLIEFLAKARGADAAEEELKRLIEAEPDEYRLRFALADLYRASAQPAEAEAAYRAIMEQAGAGPQGLRARAKLAGLLVAAGRRGEAGTLADEVLVKDPNDPDALLVTAAISLDEKDPDQAVANLRTLLKGEPDSVIGLRLLARAHAQKEEMALAQDTLERAIAVAPLDPAAYLQLADLRVSNGDLNGALLVLDRLLAQAPDSTAAQAAIARIQLGQQDMDALTKTAERALKSHPDRALGYYLKGIVLQSKGDMAASIEPFEAALEKAPNAPEPLVALAQSYLALGHADKAEARVRQLLEKQPANILAINLLGEIYLATNRLAEAQEQYAEAIRVRRTSPLAYARMAALQARGGSTDAAVETLRQGVAATNRNGFLLLQLGLFLQEAGRTDEAAALYEEVLKSYPGAKVAINNLAMLLVNERADDPASLNRALGLVRPFEGTQQPEYLDTLGWVQVKSGKLGEGVRNLEEALKGAGASPEIQYHLGMAYLKLGRAAEAKAKLGEALSTDQAFPGKDEARRALEQMK